MNSTVTVYKNMYVYVVPVLVNVHCCVVLSCNCSPVDAVYSCNCFDIDYLICPLYSCGSLSISVGPCKAVVIKYLQFDIHPLR